MTTKRTDHGFKIDIPNGALVEIEKIATFDEGKVHETHIVGVKVVPPIKGRRTRAIRLDLYFTRAGNVKVYDMTIPNIPRLLKPSRGKQ